MTRKIVAGALLVALAAALPLTALQAERRIYRVGDSGGSAPKILFKEEPKYTEEARDAHLQGAVLLTAIVGEDGRFSDIQVKRSLDPGLDSNAIEAVHKWVCRPAEKDGTAVPVSVRIEVNFRHE